MRNLLLLLSCVVVAARLVAAGTPDDHLRVQARSGLEDVLRHFWTGDEKTGHIVNTWRGYTNALPDPRGALWERATLFIALENASRALDDSTFALRLRADWQRTKSLYTPDQLEACGDRSGTSWAVDDAGWAALQSCAEPRNSARAGDARERRARSGGAWSGYRRSANPAR